MVWETDRNTGDDPRAGFASRTSSTSRNARAASPPRRRADGRRDEPRAGVRRSAPRAVLRVTHESAADAWSAARLPDAASRQPTTVPGGAGARPDQRVALGTRVRAPPCRPSAARCGSTIEPYTVLGMMRRGSDFGVLQILSRAAYSRSFADRGERTEMEIWTALRGEPRAVAAQHPSSFHGGPSGSGRQRGCGADRRRRVMSELERAFPENAASGAFVEPLARRRLRAIPPGVLPAPRRGRARAPGGERERRQPAHRARIGAGAGSRGAQCARRTQLTTRPALPGGEPGDDRAGDDARPCDRVRRGTRHRQPRARRYSPPCRRVGGSACSRGDDCRLDTGAIGFGLFPLLQPGRADVAARRLRGTGRATVSGRRKRLQHAAGCR